MGRTRTFIAIDIGDTVRDNVVALQEEFAHGSGGVKWVEPRNLHLTLHFLGEVDNLEVLRVCRQVAAVTKRIAPFTVAVEGLGAFPNARRPKVLWVGATSGAERLKDLHAQIEAPLLETGAYRREDRGYTPHLTLGRLSPDADAEMWSKRIAQHADWHAGDIAVAEVLVMGSELRRDGPVYTVLGRAKLGRQDRQEQVDPLV